MGLSGGFAFGEGMGRASMGGAGGVDLSYLHGVFGAHLSFNARPILGAGAAANLSNADLGLADDVGAVQKRGKKRKA